MLNALKAASEAYLGEPIADAEVVIPFTAPAAFYDHLRMPLSKQLPAGILAARAYGVSGKCIDGGDDPRSDPEKLLLTVGYTKADLTAQLVNEMCGGYETLRQFHNPSLGFESVQEDIASGYQEMERQIRRLTSSHLNMAMRLESRKSAAWCFEGILHMTGLHDVLEKVLGLNYGSNDEAGGKIISDHITPLFAAARGVVSDCLSRLNSEQETI